MLIASGGLQDDWFRTSVLNLHPGASVIVSGWAAGEAGGFDGGGHFVGVREGCAGLR